MADQAERIVLEAEDQVTPVVGQANTGLDSFEKKAESAHGKVIRITDQTRSSIQRLIASLEKQAEVYGKSGAERLISQRDQLLQRYAREPAAIDAITRSYEKMIAVEEKAAREAVIAKAAKEAEEALRSQSEAIKSFGDRVGQFMENPLQGARGAVSSVLSSLGPFGMGVMAGATALVGFGAAAFEAAKSLGAYGTQVKDAELRTGLTAKEVGQFGFAAKAVGQDISVVERLMRGLSQAADENSREGEKARATLQRMGIDLHTAAGEMKPTSEILIEISEGLNRLPEGLQRDAAAMNLFKRVGIEAIPFMTELNHNLHIAHEEGFGPTEDDVRRFQEYQREVSVLETKWDALVRKFKEGLVITVSFAGKGVDWFLNNVGTAGDEQRQQREEEQARQDAEQIRRVGGYGASMSRSAHRSLQRQMEGLAPGIMQDRDLIQRQIAEMQTEQQNLVGNFGWVQAVAPTDEEQGRMRKAADIQKQIEQLQQTLDAAEHATRRTDLRAGKEEAERLRARFFGTHEGMEKAYSDAKKDVGKYQKELFEPEKPLTRTEVLDLSGKLRTAQGSEARWKAALDTEKNGTEQLKEFRRAAAEFEKKGDEAELDAIQKIYYHRDLLLKQAEHLKGVEADIAGVRKAAGEQAGVLITKYTAEFEQYDQKRRSGIIGAPALGMPDKEQLKQWSEGFAAQERDHKTLAKDLLNYQEALIRLQSGPGGELETAQKIFQLRVQSADTLVEKAAVALDYLKQEAQIQTDADQKHKEELQRQQDALAQTSSGLLHTLFTKPGDFPKQLGSTIREAVLKPVTEGLGGMIGTAVHPLIYGSDGQGGIAGMFHGAFGGQQDPVKFSTDLNTAVTAQNSAAVGMLTAVLAAFMGISAPAVAAPSIPGIGSVSIPNISIAAPTGVLGGILRGAYGGLPRFAEGGITTGPTIVGEAGPELVVPLSPEIDAMRRQASVLRGPDAPDPSLRYRGILGLLRENYPGLADWIGDTAHRLWNDPGLQMLPGPMAMEVGAEAAVASSIKAVNPEPINFLFNKKAADMVRVGRRGGIASGLSRAAKAAEAAEERALSDAVYRGPEPGPIETIHEANQKLDELFPWLAGAEKDVNRASQRAGAVGGARPKRLVDGYLRWAVDPKTGKIHLGPFVPSGQDDPVGFETHADWFDRIGLPITGGKFDSIPKGYAQIDKRGEMHILDNGSEVEEGLRSRPLSDPQYRLLEERLLKHFRIPSYDTGGSVASTGLAMVHAGEAIMPGADTLKRSIDALTSEMHANTGVLGWFVNSMVQPMIGGRAPSLPIRVSGVGTLTLPSLFAGGSGGRVASTVAYTPSAVGSASTGGAVEGGYSPVGGYSPAPWAGGQGRAPSPIAMAQSANGTGGVPGSGFNPHAMLSNLKSTDWGGFTHSPSRWVMDENGNMTQTRASQITGMHGMAGAAVFTGGEMLAQQGLLGSSRGTWGGVAEGAGGGAAVGFSMGGPLGALIGGVAGFGIGIGEKVAGVKSLEQTAHDDIKSVYGVNIPTNSGTVKQVVEIAKSQFGGSISVAVRSPSVRQLVMLYSEATGQKMPLSATTPYAGSLVEQGGSLYQQASFQNNAWHMYGSNLPTLGGIPGSVYPTPGAGPNAAAGAAATSIAININGQPITPEFVTDQSMAAQGSSYGRTQQAANMQVPGLMVA